MAIRIRSDDAARWGVWQQREKQPHSAERQRHFSGGRAGQVRAALASRYGRKHGTRSMSPIP